MGHYRTGTSKAIHTPAPLPAGPVLFDNGGDGKILWVWSSPDPAAWQVDQSLDGVTWTTSFDSWSGIVRDADEGESAFYRIWGSDGLGVQITDFSNTVTS
jgi:hypothetical protein